MKGSGEGKCQGGFTYSDGLSDRATDHCPMLFVHSRKVRHRSDGPLLSVKHQEL